MSKKLIISLSITFSVIAVVLILFWTLFALSSASVNYVSTTQNLSIEDKEIVESAKFRYGACVLFEGKKKSIENIYKHSKDNENFAYLKVLNIETKFPNKYIIHVAEREELFAIENDAKYLICDRELRVLRVLDSFESVKTNPILLKGLTIKNETISIGDFLDVKQDSIKKFYSVMLRNNRDLLEQRGKFKDIELKEYEDSFTHKKYTALNINTFSNRKFIINNIDFGFVYKVQKMFAVESSLYNQNSNELGQILNSKNEVVNVVKSESGEYIPFNQKEHTEEQKIALTYALLQNCAIKVDNLTLSSHINRAEKDVVYSLVDLTV